MKERAFTWLYYAVAALPVLLVIVFWVVPKVALQRFRRPVDEDERVSVEKKLHTRVA